MKSVKDLLCTVGIVNAQTELSGSLDDEFKTIKKSYFKRVLVLHPDKGGDPEAFRSVQTAFEILRDFYEKKSVTSFALAAQQGNSTSSHATTTTSSVRFDDLFREFGNIPTPSWEFYAQAAEDPVPLYKVELAKSGRSECQKFGKKCTNKLIPKGSIRIGSILKETGTYTRWVHLSCWRVPSKIWLGLPQNNIGTPKDFEAALQSMNDVTLAGFADLDENDRGLFVAHVMDTSNWTRCLQKIGTQVVAASVANEQNKPSSEDDAIVLASERPMFEIPIPGKNGTDPNALKGKRVVLTGTFPELGGGCGLDLGKAKAKTLVESFGGRVTQSISGKTNFLLVGKDPGMAKVSRARDDPTIQLLGLKDLKEEIDSGKRLEFDANRPAHIITGFSMGYQNNGLALEASRAELLLAAGVTPKGLDSEPAGAKKKVSKKKSSNEALGGNKHHIARKRSSRRVKKTRKTRVLCDVCLIDCTDESFHSENQDYCPSCYQDSISQTNP